ncbi:MAG: zinc ABC transporter substrate-binding protein [Pseudomonadota bacterium]
MLPRSALAAARMSIVATTGMIADAARVVGGDLADVRALMGPGVDPHAYRQTRSDIVAMTRADLILYHGLHLEAQMTDILADIGRRRTVTAVADLPAEDLLADQDYDGRFDPHVWMVPELWVQVVDRIVTAMAQVQPDHAAAFEANRDAYDQELRDLGDYARSVLTTVPEESRILITAHDAFSYFGAAYGFDVEGIQGISTESEAGLNRIAELVDLLVSRKVGAVFVESSVSDRSIRALIEGAAAQGHEVRVGGELFSDAMGQDGTYEGTYLGMIDHNVTTIAGALGGTVPSGGRLGKLVQGA